MLTYHIDLEPDPSGGFTATIREFPGCVAEGESVAGAILSVISVAQEWLPIAMGLGFVVPEPTDNGERYKRRRAFLEADIGTLEQMIADRSGDPPYSRHSLERRLAQAKAELAALTPEQRGEPCL